MAKLVRVDAMFDFICPWCCIAKSNMDRAIAMFAGEAPDTRVLVNWKGTRLIPHLPAKGVPFDEFYEKRLGGPENVAARREQIHKAASAADVTLRFDRIKVMPNSGAAHNLYRHAVTRGSAVADAVMDAIYGAYFYYGQDIGDETVLLDIARLHGFDVQDIGRALSAPAPPTYQDLLGVPVPYFMFDQIHVMAGSQSAEAFVGKFRNILGSENHGASAQA